MVAAEMAPPLGQQEEPLMPDQAEVPQVVRAARAPAETRLVAPDPAAELELDQNLNGRRVTGVGPAKLLANTL